MTIKALPSQYAGILFRSRLEARWAIFFDTLGIRWEYEPEGFDLNGVPYLPDFRIHGNQDSGPLYAEVKPEDGKPPSVAFAKAHLLSLALGCENVNGGVLCCTGAPRREPITVLMGGYADLVYWHRVKRKLWFAGWGRTPDWEEILDIREAAATSAPIDRAVLAAANYRFDRRKPQK